MRVILDIRPLLENRWSGVANYTAHLLSALFARPSDNREYVSFANSFGNKFDTTTLPFLDRQHQTFCFTHYPNRLLNAALTLTGRPRIERLCGGADLIYLPNLNFIATAQPYAVTVHDLSFVHHPEFFSLKQRLWHAAVRPARLLRRASVVIAVSEHTKHDIIETYGISPDKIRVISPGVGADMRPATVGEIAAVRAKHRLPERFVLYLGTLEPRKNLCGLIAAFEKTVGDAELVLAGGKGWLYRDVFRRAATSSARDRIRFLDYVAEADKPALYSAATAFAYPSFYEGFGLPPLEAMACGTPVVASHATSLGEVVGDAGLLVDPDDVTALTEALNELLGNEALRDELTRRGRIQAERFTWSANAARLEELFSDL